MNYAIILAAGEGKRSGYDNVKTLLFYNKRPIFSYTLEAFCMHEQISNIVLVVHPRRFSEFDVGGWL